MVFGGSIFKSMRTRSVVSNHPAQFAHLAAGWIRSKSKTRWCQISVQFRINNSGLEADLFFFRFKFQNLIQAGKFEDDSGADGISDEVCSAASRG